MFSPILAEAERVLLHVLLFFKRGFCLRKKGVVASSMMITTLKVTKCIVSLCCVLRYKRSESAFPVHPIIVMKTRLPPPQQMERSVLVGEIKTKGDKCEKEKHVNTNESAFNHSHVSKHKYKTLVSKLT